MGVRVHLGEFLIRIHIDEVSYDPIARTVGRQDGRQRLLERDLVEVGRDRTPDVGRGNDVTLPFERQESQHAGKGHILYVKIHASPGCGADARPHTRQSFIACGLILRSGGTSTAQYYQPRHPDWAATCPAPRERELKTANSAFGIVHSRMCPLSRTLMRGTIFRMGGTAYRRSR